MTRIDNIPIWHYHVKLFLDTTIEAWALGLAVDFGWRDAALLLGPFCLRVQLLHPSHPECIR
jgi:hypothetical protein